MRDDTVRKLIRQLVREFTSVTDAEEGGESGNEEKEVEESCAVGTGAIGGYTLPLGADPDAFGRQKNSKKNKKR